MRGRKEEKERVKDRPKLNMSWSLFRAVLLLGSSKEHSSIFLPLSCLLWRKKENKHKKIANYSQVKIHRHVKKENSTQINIDTDTVRQRQTNSDTQINKIKARRLTQTEILINKTRKYTNAKKYKQ